MTLLVDIHRLFDLTQQNFVHQLVHENTCERFRIVGHISNYIETGNVTVIFPEAQLDDPGDPINHLFLIKLLDVVFVIFEAHREQAHYVIIVLVIALYIILFL